jgi:hypothetical protein
VHSPATAKACQRDQAAVRPANQVQAAIMIEARTPIPRPMTAMGIGSQCESRLSGGTMKAGSEPQTRRPALSRWQLIEILEEIKSDHEEWMT